MAGYFNGAMYRDLNKGISSISYNSLNLPWMVDIKNMNAEGRNEYTYSASGQKLRAVQKWNPNYNTAPVIGSDVNVGTLTNSSTTDYVGNIIYENNALKRILVDGGYYENGNYYFYVNDHLGNNRIVANAAASVVQSTQYYPFGSSFADAMGGSVQPYKYNGKELDGRNGLNWYDSNMRYYGSPLPHTPTPDPHSENYYAWSPYAWVGNNPMRIIDPTGMDWYFFDENNDYSFKSEKEGEHRFVRKEVDKEGNIKYTFGNFADPENDPKSIDNGDITSLYFPSDDELVDDLLRAGAYSQENRDNKYSYMKEHSHAGTNSGELDFVVNSGIFGKNIGLPSNYLYVRPDRNNNLVGHNNYNFGNYLWGAAANALGVGLRTAKIGAHVNNLVNDPSNQGKPILDRTLDSNDDQYSITQGWYWRESISKYLLRLRSWKKK